MGEKIKNFLDAFIFEWDEKDKAILILKLFLAFSAIYTTTVGSLYFTDPLKTRGQLNIKVLDQYFGFWTFFFFLFLSIFLYSKVRGKKKLTGKFPAIVAFITGAWILGIFHWAGALSSVIICLLSTSLALSVPFFGKHALLYSVSIHFSLFALLTVEYLGLLPYAPLGFNSKFEDILQPSNIITSIIWISVTSFMIYIFSARVYARLNQVQKNLKKQYELVKIEQAKNEALLGNILPQKVISDLKNIGKTEPETFKDVSVFFSDIVGFTSISSKLDPKRLINELSQMFSQFDNIMEAHGCERIKTIGDAYLAVAGLDGQTAKENASKLVKASLDIIELLKKKSENEKISWKIRVGIHSGDIVGGIVGKKKYIYDIFGDTVNTASRMESNSEVMRINISEKTHALLGDAFKYEERGQFQIKGKGSMKMYFVRLLNS